jgi:hypothetical protein
VFTYHPKVVEFWKQKKVPVKVAYELDGFPTWRIDVDSDDVRLKDPEYIGLALSEKMFLLPEVFARRIRLPLYGLKTPSGLAAELCDTEGSSGLALARNSGVYADMALPPGISLLRFGSAVEVYGTLKAAKERGVVRVLFFVQPAVHESIPIATAADLAKNLLH